MKNRKSFLWATLVSTFLFVGAFANSAFSQPTAAQLKALEPKTAVSFVWHRPGTREWSSTHKKYVYSIYWTAKRKTEQPGVFVTIKGYSSFDIIGGKYVYWRDFVSGNSYDGQKPPTLAEINGTIQRLPVRDFAQHEQVGEFESLRMAPKPDWEWHTMNSVSFNVIAVYRVKFSGGYYDNDEQVPARPAGKQSIDRVETHLRFRLYRDGLTVPWRAIAISKSIPFEDNKNRTREMKKFLGREAVDHMASRELQGPTRLPVLTQ